jgi:hypothetical protein
MFSSGNRYILVYVAVQVQVYGGVYMAGCECLAQCPFFNDRMKERPAMAQLYKNRFCLGGENEKCARYMIRKALGKENVPADMFPNQTERAAQIISAAGQ